MGAPKAACGTPGAAAEDLHLQSQAQAGGAQRPRRAALFSGQGFLPVAGNRQV